MAQKPSQIKARRQSICEGHISKGVWVAKAIAGGELFCSPTSISVVKTMTKDAALTRAYTNQLLAYILAGVVFTVIQVLDSMFRDRYKNKGFVIFLVQISKGIIPLSLLAILLGDSSGNLGETITVWLVVVVTIYIFTSPLYLLYWLYKKFFKKK